MRRHQTGHEGPTSAGITHAVEKAPNNRGRSGSYLARDHVEQDDHHPGAEPLDRPPRDEDRHVPGQPGQQRRRRQTATPHGRATQGPRRSPASPPTTMPTTEATRNALNGQPYQASPSSSATAVGIAVPTAIASKAMKVISISRPTVVRRCARSNTPGTLLVVRRSPTPSARRTFPTCVERRPRTGIGASAGAGPGGPVLSPCGR